MNALKDAFDKGSLAETASLLIRDPNAAAVPLGDTGLLPALYAAAESTFEVLRYLVEYSRSSLDIFDARRRNILHYAVESGDPDRCAYLIDRCGMDPLAADRDLLTPFELAFKLSRGIFENAATPAGRRNDNLAGRKAVYELLMARVGAPFEDMYRNPIRRGFFPDPSVVAVGKDFYMVNSSFIFFPCIPISHSRDLISWEIIGFAITDPKAAGLDDLEGGRGYWAPDISYDNGTFYVTATYRLNDTGPVYRRQIVVSSDKPEGPYSAPSFIEEDGIDPSLFHENGRHYMLLNRGARLMELSSDCKRQISEAKLLYYGSQKHAPEGSHLLKKDGYYYLFQAEGGTGPGHRITVARSRELFGVYEPCPYNPIMRQTDPEAAIQRCGHGKPVQTPDGSWYMVYLCGRTLDEQYSVLGRETALDPITWTADGWPLVNNLKGPSALQLMPMRGGQIKGDGSRIFEETPKGGSSETRKPSPLTNLLLTPTSWLTPRPPQPAAVAWNPDGTVTLLTSPAPLSSVDARNIFLTRQDRFDFTAEAHLSLPALLPGQEAGIIGYYDENSFVLSSVFARADGSLAFRTTEHIGHTDLVHEDPAVSLPGGAQDFIFTMETRGLARTFRIKKEDAGKTRILHEVSLTNVYYLSDEGVKLGKRFTGAMMGVAGAGGERQFHFTLTSFTIV